MSFLDKYNVDSILTNFEDDYPNNSCYLPEGYSVDSEHLLEGEYYYGEVTNIKREGGNSPCVAIFASIESKGKRQVIAQRYYIEGEHKANYYNKLLVLLGGIWNYPEVIKKIDFTSTDSFVSTSKFLIGAPVKYLWKNWDNTLEEKYFCEKVENILILEGIYDSTEEKVINKKQTKEEV